MASPDMDLPNRFEGNEEGFDLDDYEEKLPCSWRYVSVCILLSSLNGLNFAFVWPAYTLHFTDMGWSLVTAGLAITVGYIVRMTTQQIQLFFGYWIMVPLALIHETFAVLGLVYWNKEWAVFAQIVVAMGIDSTCAIEGICFDSFGDSESLARQASSTCLSVFTVASALSCFFGGIVYDLAGWPGVGTYHTVVEGLLLLIMAIEPAVQKSFVAQFSKRDPHPEKVEAAPETDTTIAPKTSFATVVPGPKETAADSCLPGAVEDLKVEDVEEEILPEQQLHGGGADLKPASTSPAPATGEPEEVLPRLTMRTNRLERPSFASNGSAGSGQTQGTHATARTRGTARTGATRRSAATGRTVLSAVSRLTDFSRAGEDFRHHFGTSSALQPRIVGATGDKSVMRDEVVALDPKGEVIEREAPTKTTGIPKHVRFPAFLIVLSCLCNTGSYAIEFATFAIYFKQVHNWTDATFASVAQTAGDVLAAIVMQVIPVFFSGDYDPDEFGCFRRSLHYIMSQPYSLSVVLGTWTMWNVGMMSPVLPVAITAQIFMGTSYVYGSKWATDMNLFYSLGDSQVFLTMQVYCRNAEALGGAIGGLLAVWLFTLEPIAPFAFSSALACIIWITYTVGFCVRLGFGDDIESAEEKRSRRLGIRRVSSWAVDVRKSTKKSSAEA